jgi:predicted transcriptional regulator
MAGFSIRLPEELEDKLDAEARREGVPRAEVARLAIAEFLARRERERFVAALVAEARAAYADPKIRRDALTVAEDFAAADSEALDLAEGKPVAARATTVGRSRRRR